MTNKNKIGQNHLRKPNNLDIFHSNSINYINDFKLYVSFYKSIPNYIEEINIDCKKGNLWFQKHFKDDINDYHFCKRYFDENKKAEFDDVYYHLYEDLVVYFDTNFSKVRLLFRKTNLNTIENITKHLQKFRKKKARRIPEISLLLNTDHGIRTKSLQIKNPNLNLEINYNDDFKEAHNTILKRLSKKNDKGLVILYGQPGTGKTSYIRHLISLTNKDIIFLPSNMANAITNPNLISILLDNRNSIFVIEDAENIVIDRERDGSSPVSALLNLSDGLLADCLNIQIICSFNTDISKIDSALLRKGRLIAKYEFKSLEIKKAQLLSDKIGFSETITGPMALSDIYNQAEKNFQTQKKKNPIGFQVYRKNEIVKN